MWPCRSIANDLDPEVLRDGDHPAGTQLPARVNHRLVVRRVERPQEKNLGGAATLPMAKEPRPKDLRGIQHEGVARRDQRGDVAEGAVRQLPGGAIEHQQTTRIARLNRLLRDAFVRERIVVIGGAHPRGGGGIRQVR